jgi:hypothetical protein
MLASCSAYSSALKMEVICSSETSVHFYRTMQCYIPEDGTWYITTSVVTANRSEYLFRNFEYQTTCILGTIFVMWQRAWDAGSSNCWRWDGSILCDAVSHCVLHCVILMASVPKRAWEMLQYVAIEVSCVDHCSYPSLTLVQKRNTVVGIGLPLNDT